MNQVAPMSERGGELRLCGSWGAPRRKALQEVAAACGALLTMPERSDEEGLVRALVVDLDDAGARARCQAVRSEPRFASTPLLGLCDAPTGLSFAEAFAWGVDDVVARGETATLIQRIRALRPGREPAARRGSVVVADPDPGWRGLVARSLRNASFDVVFAQDEGELRRKLASEPRALVVASTRVGALDVVRGSAHGEVVPWILVAPPREQAEARRATAAMRHVSLMDALAPLEDVLFLANDMLSPQAADRRASVRLLFGTCVWLRPARSAEDTLGYSYTISRGGLFVRTLVPIEVGTSWWLEFEPPRAGGRIRVSATAVWTRPFGPLAAAVSPAGAGFRIDGALPGDMDVLAQGCERLAGDTGAWVG